MVMAPRPRRVIAHRVLGMAISLACIAGVSAVAGAPTASAEPGGPAFAIALHTRSDVKHFDTFRYNTATAINVAPAAAARINTAVGAIVTRNVREAVANARFPCVAAPGRCGVLDATLTQLPCVGGYLCVQQFAEEYWPGAATSNQAVDALVFDPTTGATVPISEEVAPSQMRAFVASVRDAVRAYQVKNGFYDPIFMKLVKPSTMKHWAPLADGIHIWFDKYVAGPGIAGVVEVTVPYPSAAVIKP